MAKMTHSLTISLVLALFPAVRPSHAAKKPHARGAEEGTPIWTNGDLERLRGVGLISVVGHVSEEATAGAAAPSPHLRTQDPEWYAEQASKLRAELKNRGTRLQHYRQALEGARNLQTMTGGINLARGDTGITPDASIEILQRRVHEIQSELDALEDLARHNGIPPGTLRGR
jgi:hypothetical protein